MINFFIILALILGLQQSAALKDVVVKFPDHVVEGDDIEITCQYNLEEDILYNLKWYKGTIEFFRYSKGEQPQIKVFHVENVNVDLSSSSMNTVKLLSISHGSEGEYRCEVSTDLPTFLTLSNYKTLKVEPLEDLTTRNIYMVIPPIVIISESVKMSCSYNPIKDNTPLKSVAWQKNGQVFYKYEPDSEINVAVEKCPGIKFSVKQKANSSEVTIHDATADAEDVYTCQIDYPASTLTSSSFLLVRKNPSNPVTVTVPAMVNKEDNVKLKCEFNFNASDISAVKWFKDNQVFYSYTPNGDCTITSFEGVDVQDLITSDDYRSFVSIVLLKNVTDNTAGSYKCQVSTNNGSHFYMSSKNLAVIRLPHGEPTLIVKNKYLRRGNYLHAECISPPSYPYADITWLLNGKEVSGDLHKVSEEHNFLLYPSSSRLSHAIDFDEGSDAELTCVVTISDIYRRETSVKIEKDPSFVTPQFYRKSSLAANGGNSWTKTSVATIVISFVLLLNW